MNISHRWIALSVVAAVLAAGTSLAGILWPNTYARETPEWSIQAVGQDCANLLVVLVVLQSAALVRKGSWRALLVWLGGLLYLIYAFAIYAFSVHFNRFFLAYVSILGLSFYAVVGSLVGLDVAKVVAPLRDHPRRKGASALLIVIGVTFGALWLSEIVPHTLEDTIPRSLIETGLWTNPVHALDLAFLLPAMVLVGVLLRKQEPWGLLLTVPLLVFAITMGLAILALFTLSAMNGHPVVVPAALAIVVIVLSSGVYTWLLLRPPAPAPERGGAKVPRQDGSRA
jgi:hypothetical protein